MQASQVNRLLSGWILPTNVPDSTAAQPVVGRTPLPRDRTRAKHIPRGSASLPNSLAPGPSIFVALVLLASLVAPFHAFSQATTSPSQRLDALLSRMTLDEKIGQMVLYTSSGKPTGPTSEFQDLDVQVRRGACGGVFNSHTVERNRQLQQIAVKETRLGIPLLFGYDVIHGFRTLFPVPLGEASSWDLAAIERSERIAAIEASAWGVNWTFAPMVDIARDPRWGRIVEGAGEDPYLGSEIARARVRGFQGNDLSDASTILSCVKHFAAYGAAEAGRDYNTVDMSERTLREVYLPPYAAALDAGAFSIMTAFNDLNGVPATANRFLLKEILRREWGFRGFVVTDYSAINQLVDHGIAADQCDAARQALDAGVDMDMESAAYAHCLRRLVVEGQVSERQIDDSVRRILTAKMMLGLFDDPYRYFSEERERKFTSPTPEHLKAAYELACESMVLLKNSKGILPLQPGRHIAVLGPLADSRNDLLGSWRADGRADSVETILEAIRTNNSAGQVAFARGCQITANDPSAISNAVAVAESADVVVMVLGESADMTGEAASRTSIRLPGLQTRLLREIGKTGKPIVLVLMNGRPLALEAESSLADAILEAWFPGTEGGKAVADILFGKRNPSGKLTVTFPRNLGQVPIYYAEKSTGRPFDPARPDEKYKSRYIDSPNDPLFPFGFGLSYTTFKYSNIRLNRRTLRPGETIRVSVKLTNTGRVAGAEIVQLYLHKRVADVTRPVRELKGFQRIELPPGATRNVVFTLSGKDLMFLRRDMTWGTEPGTYEVFVGPNSRDLQWARFNLEASRP
jgi:beta-glucosidase